MKVKGRIIFYLFFFLFSKSTSSISEKFKKNLPSLPLSLTKNSFDFYINAEGLTCSEQTSKNELCMTRKEDGEYYYQCNNEKNEYCFEQAEESDRETVKCRLIKRFYGQKCTENGDCFTNRCVNNKCEYKMEGDDCKQNKECDLKSYCDIENTNKCVRYVNEEERDCSDRRCSPRYVCIEGVSTCFPKASLGIGAEAKDAQLCKSFKRDSNNKCTDKYDTDPKSDDYYNKLYAEYFPKIVWEDQKLSDYEGINMGSPDILDKFFENEMSVIRERYGNETYECTIKVYRQLMVLYMTDNYGFSDEKIKKYLNISEPKEDDPPKEESNKKLIIICSAVGGVALIALISVLVYCFACKNKNKDDVYTVDNQPILQ